ncbi:MAG: DUF2066 domain-containing protein [Legionellales bacterium]|nr:DUF2066 domain-containing protein [Legionellales bacterium]
MSRYFSSLLASLMIFVSSSGFAQAVNSFYQVDIPIANMSAQTRQQAFVQALQAVLVKISGQSSIINNATLKQQWSKADTYVDQFNFFDKKMTQSDGMPEQQLYLNVHFDPSSIDHLLTQAKQPIWGHNRPTTLVWIVQQTATGKTLINDTANPVSQLIDQAAKTRGITLLFPLLDLQDMNNINDQTVWEFNQESIKRASARYAVPAILVGKMQVDDQGNWRAQWQNYIGNDQTHWETQGKNLTAVLNPAINTLADTLASHFKTNEKTDFQTASLTVMGVNQLATFDQIKTYLAGLKVVKEVEIANVEPDYVVFNLQINGTVNELTAALANDQKLKINSDPSSTAAANHLITHWVG